MSIRTLLSCTALLLTLLPGIQACSPTINKSAEPEQDSLVYLTPSLSLLLPTSYTINQGAGDDSEFTQILNADGSIVLGNEVGPLNPKPPPLKLEALQKMYPSSMIAVRDKANASANGATPEEPQPYQILLFYRETTGTFRNAEGKVYLRYNTNYQEVASVSFAREKEVELLQLLSSLRVVE